MEKLKNSNNKFVKIFLKLIEKNKEFKLNEVSAVVVYYLLLSIGPFLVLGFSIMTYFLQEHIDTVLSVANSVYEDASIILSPIMDYLASTNNRTFAIVGGLITLFSASKASKFIIKAFNNIFEINEGEGIKNFILNNIYAMIFTLALLVSLIVFFVFFVTGDPIASVINFLFNIDLNQFFLWGLLRNLIPIVYLFLFLTIIFKLLSKFGGEKISFKEAIIGSSFVTIGWIIGSLGFAFYINNFNNNNAIYGALGSIMVIMLWFYLLIYMLLLGAALIDSYMEVKDRTEIEDLKRPFQKDMRNKF